MSSEMVSSRSATTIKVLLLGVSQLLSLHIFFLGPLKGEAEQMHQQQIDPTDIVQIPYDLTRLAYYVLTVAGSAIYITTLQQQQLSASATTTMGTRLRYKLSQYVQLSFLCFVMMIVSGRSLVEHWQHTALAASYVTALCLCDVATDHHHQSRTTTTTSAAEEFKRRLRGSTTAPAADEQGNSTAAALQGLTVAQVCLAVTVPLQILRLYDRGWQVQRWPVPVILGSTYGWVLGHALLVLLPLLLPSSSSLSTAYRQQQQQRRME